MDVIATETARVIARLDRLRTDVLEFRRFQTRSAPSVVGRQCRCVDRLLASLDACVTAAHDLRRSLERSGAQDRGGRAATDLDQVG